MTFLATGKYDILRGEGTNVFGDDIDTDGVVVDAAVGSVVERRRTAYNPVSGRSETVRVLTGRFVYTTDVQDGDRLRDVKTGNVYLVENTWYGNSPVHKSDIVLDLRRV